VKHAPAKGARSITAGAHTLVLIFASLGHFTTGKPGLNTSFNVHNGEGPYSHPDVVSPAFLGALTPKKPHFRSPNLATKDLRDLLTNHLESKFTIIRKNYKKSLLCGLISQTSAEKPPKNGGVRKAKLAST
jgi:hypothetical protein